MSRPVITIGMLGCGIVGTGTVRTLQDNQEAIERKVGASMRIKRICVRDLGKSRPDWIDRQLLTTDPALVLDDPEIDVVAELMGGIEPARGYLQRAIRAGKHVVTANKELLAKWKEADKNNDGVLTRGEYLEVMIAKDWNTVKEKVAGKAGKTVTATGKVVERNGMKVLQLLTVE